MRQFKGADHVPGPWKGTLDGTQAFVKLRSESGLEARDSCTYVDTANTIPCSLISSQLCLRKEEERRKGRLFIVLDLIPSPSLDPGWLSPLSSENTSWRLSNHGACHIADTWEILLNKWMAECILFADKKAWSLRLPSCRQGVELGWRREVN